MRSIFFALLLFFSYTVSLCGDVCSQNNESESSLTNIQEQQASVGSVVGNGVDAVVDGGKIIIANILMFFVKVYDVFTNQIIHPAINNSSKMIEWAKKITEQKNKNAAKK